MTNTKRDILTKGIAHLLIVADEREAKGLKAAADGARREARRLQRVLDTAK